MSAEFDSKKDAANVKKHGVSLSDGDGVLNDPIALTVEDDSAEGEHRFVTVGMNLFGSRLCENSENQFFRECSTPYPDRENRIQRNLRGLTSSSLISR